MQVRGLVVLDAACGTGFGAQVLSEAGAALVAGVDLDPEAVSYAHRERSETTWFVLGDVTRLPFTGSTFDMVTTFETIEHVPDFVTCLQEFSRVLKEGGVLFCSTPNRAVSSPDGIIRNPYHVREFTVAEFRRALGEVFRDVQILGQWCRRNLAASFLRRLIWRCLTLRGVRKLPFSFRKQLSRALTHAPLFPAWEEFDFLTNPNPTGAATLIGVCRKSGAEAARADLRRDLKAGA